MPVLNLSRAAGCFQVSILLFMLCPGFASWALADVSLPAVIGSNMVLQREKSLPIWGWAAPGEKVTVSLGKSQSSAIANEQGEWLVKLPAMEAGGPHKMNVSGANTIELIDIMVGEVWVCSGQSNMQWPVARAENPQEEVSAATYPQIRLFHVPLKPAGSPAMDVHAEWVACAPQTIPHFSAVAYFFGRELHRALGVPVGLIATSWGGTRIEPWTPPAGFASQPETKGMAEQLARHEAAYQEVVKQSLEHHKTWLVAAKEALAAGQPIPAAPTLPPHPLNSNGVPTGLYNGMVHPLVPFAARGVIWYQGEANRGQGMLYHTMMKALIAGWRRAWNDEKLAFYFVQLAPFRYNGSPTALPEIWEAQTATLAVPHTGMVVTTDIGAIGDIHPTNKQEVGRRLALWALANTYGQREIVYSGPLYDSMEVEIDTIRLKFKHGAGLKSRDGKSLDWFEIAGEDRKFVPALAEIDGDTVIVSSSKVDKPVAARFGWDQLAEPNLVNGAGLPAAPFRTDRWGTEPPGFPRN